jgi:hypothetical protein
MVVHISPSPAEEITAAGLLLPVDGLIPNLGSGAARAIRAALPADERMGELEYLGEQLAELRPLPVGEARVIEWDYHWNWIVVTAAYPHNTAARSFSPHECAAILRAGVAGGVRAAVAHGLASMTMTVIGTAYRMDVGMAVRAQADGLAAEVRHNLTICWSIPDAAALQLAREACLRLGLRVD